MVTKNEFQKLPRLTHNNGRYYLQDEARNGSMFHQLEMKVEPRATRLFFNVATHRYLNGSQLKTQYLG